jgi:hypothetical protein
MNLLDLFLGGKPKEILPLGSPISSIKWAHDFDRGKILTGTPSFQDLQAPPEPQEQGDGMKVVMVAVAILIFVSGCSSRVDCWVQAGF